MSSEPPSSSEERYLINVAKTEMREGYRLADVERVLAVYSDGCFDMSDGWPTFAGPEFKAVLRARLEAQFRRNSVQLIPLTSEIKVLGSFAVAYGWHEVKRMTEDGDSASVERTRSMELWSKEQDGQWRIVFQIDNRDQPDAFAEDVIAAALSS